MKKLLLFTFALFLWTGAWAQNLSQGKYVHLLANGKSGVTESSLQGLTNGNTTGDVQLATYDEGTSTLSPIQAFYIDLGEAKDLARVVIYWEGALCTNYSIKGSSTTADSNEPTWDLNFGTYEVARGSTHTETHEAPDNFSTRYIKFEPANNGSTEGYSNPNWTVKMREFQVFGTYTQILSGLKFDQNIKKVGTSQVFIAKPIDQNGNEITSGSFTYSISPSAGVTFNQNGNTLTITASQGVYNITATDGENNTTVPIGLASAPDDPSIDSDKAIVIYSEALGYGQSGSDAAVGYRTPNSSSWGFVNWSENRKSLAYRQVGAFGVARPGLSTDGMADIVSLEFDMFSTKAVDDAQLEIEDCYNSGHVPGLTFDVVAGWHHYSIPIDPAKTNFSPAKWLFFYLADPKDENIDILIDNIYYSKEAEVDKTKPEMASAALASKTHNSATLTLNATDNSGKVKFHIVDTSNSIDVTSGNADSGVNFSYTVTGLTAETSYNFTITAVDASDNVSDESKSVEVTTNSAPPGIDLTAGGHTIHVTPYHYSNNVYKLVITSDDEMSGLGGSFWNVNRVGTDMRTNSETHTFNVSQDKKTITITCTSTSAPNMYTPLYVMMPGEVNFGYVILNWIDVVQAVTITSAGWASFSSDKDLNFDGIDNLSAYKATVNGENDVTLVEVTEVKAGEGIILKGTADTYNVPVMISAPDALAGNLLKPGYHKVTKGEVGSIYAFGKYNGGVAFVKAAENYEVSEGRAYLDVSSTSAKNAEYLNFYIGQEEGETDGINKMNTLVETGVRYNLAGQRVGNDYKGIVIVNGRKVVIK